MADDVTLPGTGDVIAADAVTGTGEKVQLFKLAYSADGSRTLVPCDANGLTVQSQDATKFLVTEASGTTIVAGLSSILSELGQKLEPGDLSGLATSGKQDTGNISLSSIDGKITAVNTGAVVISGALPAGNANIGDVDVASIAAGDNNIGNVDVVTLPALVAGSAIIGNVRIDQTTPGTTNAVQANAGTNLNTSLLALEAGGNLASIKTAVEVIDNFISGSKGLVTEDNSASIKTAVETIDNFISGARGLVTEDNSAAILSGMATAANQTTEIASLATIATNTAPLITAQAADGTSVVGPMVQALVNDTPSTYNVGVIQPLSLTTEGRLRVSSVQSSINQIWQETFTADPWDDSDSLWGAFPSTARSALTFAGET